MRQTYESFEEIAEAFVDGEAWTHRLSGHDEAQCLTWQHAIREFACWLDRGIALPADEGIYDRLWSAAPMRESVPRAEEEAA